MAFHSIRCRASSLIMARSKVYKSKPKPAEEELPSEDEIDAFNKQKDFVSLDAAKQSDSDDVEDDGIYDLSDDSEASDDEFDSDDSDAEGGTLGRREHCSSTKRFVELHTELLYTAAALLC